MKVSLSDTRGLSDSAVFVMYNCARLATLFQHFTEAVGKGFMSSIYMFHLYVRQPHPQTQYV